VTRSRRYSFLNYLGFGLVVGFFATPAFAQLCLDIDGSDPGGKTIPINSGDQVRLHFKHSIYGSAVDEIFTVREQGLQLTELRYGEARLVDFYGHEQSHRENGVWVVRPHPVIFPALRLSVSDDAAMSLFVHTAVTPVNLRVPPGSALRVSVSSCKPGPNG